MHLLGNLSLTLFLTLLVLISAFLLGKPLNYLVCALVRKIVNKQQIRYQVILKHIIKPAGLMSQAFIWLMVLNFMPPFWKSLGGIPLFLSQPTETILMIVVKVIVGSSLVWMVYNLSDWFIEKFLNRISSIDSHSSWQAHFMPFITRFVKVSVICFGSLLILQSIGVNVLSLMAGVGLGGVALALAAKDSAANILAYLNIMIDKPFSTGDWISFDNIEGTVIEVGLRSSKIKTFYDSVISIPNANIAAANIDNLTSRKARRIRVYLGVQYDTLPEKIEQFIEGIREILRSNTYVKQDYFQVYFSDLAASELKIIVNFFLNVPNWEIELEQRHHIFIHIFKLAAKLKVQFAFPTQTIHVGSMPKIHSIK